MGKGIRLPLPQILKGETGMATTKKETEAVEKTEAKAVKQEVQGVDFEYLTLPKLEGKNANQMEFFSVNFKSYLVKRGVKTKVPMEVYRVWQASERMRNERIDFANANALREPTAQ